VIKLSKLRRDIAQDGIRTDGPGHQQQMAISCATDSEAERHPDRGPHKERATTSVESQINTIYASRQAPEN